MFRTYERELCNYIDIPLQHISDSILKSMRRGNTTKKNSITKGFRAAVPVWQFATTLIVGYPGETQEDFMIFERFCARNEIDRWFCHYYMRKTRMLTYLEDDVPDNVKQDRANEIMELNLKFGI
jgi:ribosomal protein S12 methylthiotransferase